MKSSNAWSALLAGTALVVVPVAALGGPAVHRVVLQAMKFGPPPAGLRVGDTLEWVNDDIFVHTATARDGSFDLELKPKSRVRMRLTKAGVIPFICSYHPGMTGVLKVSKP